MKRRYKLHEGDDQVPTRPASLEWIIGHPKFAQGVADQRAGRGFPADIDAWGDTNDAWNYERGRQWAMLAPRSVALKINGRISMQAVRWYSRAEILGPRATASRAYQEKENGNDKRLQGRGDFCSERS